MKPGAQETGPALSGLRILVVEDEMLIMMMLKDILVELGTTVTTAARLAKATLLAEQEPFDAAILDVNVAGETVYPVAQILKRRNIPFILSTGYGEGTLPSEFRDCPILSKPYLAESIKEALTRAPMHRA